MGFEVLSARDMQAKVARVQCKRQKVYEMVYERCVKGKLHDAARQGIPFCMANIQSYMPGLPAFNALSCSMHIRDALVDKGFHVQLLPPNNLLISWIMTSLPQSQQQQRITNGGSGGDEVAEVPFDYAAFKKPNGKKVMFI